MLESVLSSPEAHARIGRSWLRKPIDDFLMHLAEHRYSRGTMRVCSYQLLAFGEFLAQQGILDLAIMPAWIDPFVEQVVCSDGHRRMLRLALLRFIHFLQQKQTIPTPVPRPPLEGAGSGWPGGHRLACRVPRRSREAKLALLGPRTPGGEPGGGTRRHSAHLPRFRPPGRLRALLHRPSSSTGKRLPSAKDGSATF